MCSFWSCHRPLTLQQPLCISSGSQLWGQTFNRFTCKHRQSVAATGSSGDMASIQELIAVDRSYSNQLRKPVISGSCKVVISAM